MTSKQYEELCRLFVAEQAALPLEAVCSIKVVNPTRPDLPEYSHQLDLYWEKEDNLVRYLHIANAKWRAPSVVVGPADVLLLAKVREKGGPHKAVLITSNVFSRGAIAAARDEGVALYIVKPAFDVHALTAADSIAIQAELRSIAKRSRAACLYTQQMIHKGLESAGDPVDRTTRRRFSLADPGRRSVVGSATSVGNTASRFRRLPYPPGTGNWLPHQMKYRRPVHP